MNLLAGPVTAQLFNPTNGSYSAITGSPFTNQGTHTMATPGDNGFGVNDWLLVLNAKRPDDASGARPPR